MVTQDVTGRRWARGSRVFGTSEDVIPTTSGALVLHYTLPGRHQPTVLARSIDAGWSKFMRAGGAPRTGPIAPRATSSGTATGFDPTATARARTAPTWETRGTPPTCLAERAALYVRLKMTRPLGMVFIAYFGEWA